MRQKRLNKNAKKKRINKIPITPTKEPEDKDKDVPKMEVRDWDRVTRLVVRIRPGTDAFKGPEEESHSHQFQTLPGFNC